MIELFGDAWKDLAHDRDAWKNLAGEFWNQCNLCRKQTAPYPNEKKSEKMGEKKYQTNTTHQNEKSAQVTPQVSTGANDHPEKKPQAASKVRASTFQRERRIVTHVRDKGTVKRVCKVPEYEKITPEMRGAL